MSKTRLIIGSAILLVLSLGCSSQSAKQSGDTASGEQITSSTPPESIQTAEQEKPVIPNADIAAPDAIVKAFLDALRSGDAVVAEGLMTDTARSETAKHDLAVQPPGTPEARYQIGKIEFVSEKKDGAHVSSLWTEQNGQGAVTSYEVVWVLRKQPDGWRIAGMATQLVPDQQPVFLNFEDPADMLAKWEAADAELARREETAAAQQAQRPAESSTDRIPR